VRGRKRGVKIKQEEQEEEEEEEEELVVVLVVRGRERGRAACMVWNVRAPRQGYGPRGQMSPRP